MAARKGVRNIAVAVSGTSGYETVFSGILRGATVYKGSSVEVDKIAAYGDPAYTSVPRSVKSWDEYTFTVLDQGSQSVIEGLTGKVTNIYITADYGDGAGDDTSVVTSGSMVITHVAPGGEITLDGGTESTVVITAVPHV